MKSSKAAFRVCPEGVFDITSPCSIEFLRVVLPLSLIAIYLLALIPYPKQIRKVFSPFNVILTDPCSLYNLTPASVKEEVAQLRASGKATGPAKWRWVLLVSVPLLETMGWWGLMGWSAMVGGLREELRVSAWEIWMPAAIGISWLYMATTHFLHPSPQPPLGSFFLINVHLIPAIISIGSAAFERNATGSWPSYVTLPFAILELLNVAACLVLDIAIMGMQMLDPDILARMETAAEDNVTLWQWMTFSWVDPLIQLGNKKDLESEDIPELSYTQKTAPVFEVMKATTGRSLLVRVLKVNGMDIFIDFALTLVSATLMYTPPYFIKQILDAIADGSREAISRAYVYAVLSFLAAVLKAESDVLHLWHARRASTRLKSQLTAAIYEKTLRRKDASGVLNEEKKEEAKEAVGEDGKKKKLTKVEKAQAKADKKAAPKRASNSGKVTNLMTSDVNRITSTLTAATMIYSPIVEIPIALVFLTSILGWSACAGCALMVISMPLNNWLMRRSTAIYREIYKARDVRIDLTQEVLESLKFIKFAGWVTKFQNKIGDARATELRHVVQAFWIGIGFNISFSTFPVLVTLISFSLYVFVAKGKMTAAVAFTAINLFGQLRQPLSSLPSFLVWFNQAYVALNRIDEFLAEPEVPDWVCQLSRDSKAVDKGEDSGIGFRHASLKWYDGVYGGTATAKTGNLSGQPLLSPPKDTPEVAEPFQLSDVTLRFPEGKLSVIVGPTGSGKSALITSLIGEMDLLSGETLLRKDPLKVDAQTGLRHGIAICTQVPYLQGMSIKDNILFNEPFDEERYNAVLDACSLRPDLDILEDGDDTEVGHNGVSLSGGQKARVALARAVYARNRYCILDDVLSALDAGTGRSVYEKCLIGPLMKDRTVILVTHHLDLVLPGASYLVRLVDGAVECAGTIGELRAKGLLDSLVATEKSEVKTEEPVVNQEDLEQEIEATDGPAPDSADAKKPKGPGKKLISKEEQSTGTIKMKVYLLYFRAAGYWVWVGVLACMLLAQVSSIAERLWIKVWSEAYRHTDAIVTSAWNMPASTRLESDHLQQHHYHAPASFDAYHSSKFYNATSVYNAATTSTTWPDADARPGYYITVFGIIMLGTALASTVVGSMSWLSGYYAGKNLHERMVVRVTRATMRWMDQTPSGRIMSRFVRDTDNLDSAISGSLRMMLSQCAELAVTVITVTAIIPQFIVPATLLFFVYYALTAKYLTVVRDLRRFGATRRSPIFSSFDATLEGISVIRAFSMETLFMDKLNKQIDDSQSPDYYMWMTNRWLLLRFDCLGAVVIFLATFFCLFRGISGGLSGVAIVSANSMTRSLYWISRFAGALQQDANSIERAQEYLELPQEPPGVIESSRPPAFWPSDHSKDFLVVENLTVKYAPDLPSVLKGVSFTVKPREKIGVVGRTGSGKSSFAMSLLRFVDPSDGRILIDGIDITSIGVDDLRTKLTYISQEACIFSGTVRENLDPFGEHDEAELLEALDRVSLGAKDASHNASRAVSTVDLPAAEGEAETTTETSSVTIAPGGKKTVITLDSEVSAGGTNFSSGQRQLLSLARALIRRSALIIADEATASIDFATDELIQKAIRTEFKESCVVTIAHRLSTVMDMDKILVLAKGGLAEFDTPWNLLQKEDGILKGMCEQSGKYQQLRDIAEKASKL